MSEIANQFTGLPMADLIGGPLQAACEAQINLAGATADFIQRVGFSPDSNDIRMVNFSFTRPGTNVAANEGFTDYGLEKVEMNVPFLSLVNTPSLSLKRVSVTFDMEVKNSTSQKESSDKSGSLDANASIGISFFKANVKISGSISSHKENTRSSDTSAKYHVEVLAEDTGMPEGLCRVLDILQSAIAPVKISDAGTALPSPGGAG
ncbi:MAG: DUF2589 domain-containing protein [Proteobacteria bacterium]|uniref:DUF2589 domain-containing protein n=1 Tax=Candidatus Avisuccinivibrio stercorigallinarum TaxID=2840704 RepID=A0A9D9DB15_9GAMM|nr:DUF2589 domain-containing protein [Candidatus Avisuccinivibrio stercorigallinarum]